MGTSYFREQLRLCTHSENMLEYSPCKRFPWVSGFREAIESYIEILVASVFGGIPSVFEKLLVRFYQRCFEVLGDPDSQAFTICADFDCL